MRSSPQEEDESLHPGGEQRAHTQEEGGKAQIPLKVEDAECRWMTPLRGLQVEARAGRRGTWQTFGVVRERKVAVEKICDELDLHHDKKVDGDMAKSATAVCGMTGMCAMTSAPEADGDSWQECDRNMGVVENRKVPVTKQEVHEGRWIPDEREVRARAVET